MKNEILVYLMSPVRQVTEEQSRTISGHAEALKNSGAKLFNPIEDAPQEDKTGYNIVMAELNFMHKAALEGGRVDILWNAGGVPSEGSRVDLGMAIALELDLNLVAVFNEEQPTGPQIGYQLIKELEEQDLENSPVLREILAELDIIKNSKEIIVDWDTDMMGMEQERQRIRLGLVLGCMARNQDLKMKLGKVVGYDHPDKKSYVKVIKEIIKNGGVSSV